MKIEIEITDQELEALKRQWKLISECFDDNELTYPFKQFLHDIIKDEVVFINTGVHPLCESKSSKKEKDRMVEIIRKYPGLTPRQLMDIMSDPSISRPENPI